MFAALYKTFTVRKENPKPLGFLPISLSPSALAYTGSSRGSWVGLCHFSHSPAQHASHSTQHCGLRREEALRSPQYPILQQPSCAPPAHLPGPGEEAVARPGSPALPHSSHPKARLGNGEGTGRLLAQRVGGVGPPPAVYSSFRGSSLRGQSSAG